MNNVKPFREDIIEKVTGRAMYAADFIMPHMLYAKMLWPKYPSAKILKIDTSKAELLPGVERVITRKEKLRSLIEAGIQR
jgi:CO/xanthine dehydrogenase Mo-binding subunit